MTTKKELLNEIFEKTKKRKVKSNFLPLTEREYNALELHLNRKITARQFIELLSDTQSIKSLETAARCKIVSLLLRGQANNQIKIKFLKP